jgi:hypothetical protein
VLGGTVSTVHDRDAGEASTLPAGSVARTANECDPSASPEYARGDVHAAHSPLSIRHSNDEPASDEENANDALVSFVSPAGPPEIDVTGGVVSIVQFQVGGEGSTLPAPSVARTENACAPSPNPL